MTQCDHCGWVPEDSRPLPVGDLCNSCERGLMKDRDNG